TTPSRPGRGARRAWNDPAKERIFSVETTSLSFAGVDRRTSCPADGTHQNPPPAWMRNFLPANSNGEKQAFIHGAGSGPRTGTRARSGTELVNASPPGMDGKSPAGLYFAAMT